MRYGYYPGCSLHSTGAEYDLSLRAVCARMEIELEEIKDWICCGSSAAHVASPLLATALPVQILAQAEQNGFVELIVPCAACFSRLKFALADINNPDVKSKIDRIIGYEFGNKIKVVHPLEVLNHNSRTKTVKESIKQDLSDLKVVCYYGCLLTRPPKIMQFDECEYPRSVDEVLSKSGVRTLDWSYKTDCCGASLALTRTDVVLKLANDILANAKAVGADAIAVACPLCHANLDMRQAEVNDKFGVDYDLPVFYFTQLMGLAFGISEKELGIDKHFVSPQKAMDKIK